MLHKIFLLFIFIWITTFSYAVENKPLIFGVLNMQSPAKTAQRWNPILKYLTYTTGYTFELKMGATVEETDEMMKREEFDLVFTNHNFRKGYDGTYKVIAKWAGEPIHCVIAVLENSTIKTIKDLQGKKVAFPSQAAFIAYAVPMVTLKKNNITVEQIFAGNQEGVLAQLKANQVDAIAINSRFLTKYATEQNLKYKELFVSEGYAEIPVIIHPRLTKQQNSAIKKALLAIKTDPQAASVLRAADFGGFESATEKDYKNARQIYKSIE